MKEFEDFSDEQITPQEKRVREQRTIEASKADLMGANGKLAMIAKNLGEEIFTQHEGGRHVDERQLPDFLDLDNDKNNKYFLSPGNPHEIQRQLPITEVLDANGNPIEEPTGFEWAERHERTNYDIYSIGHYFDGLSRGMHLEIKYYKEMSKIQVHFKGYEVYLELEGELHKFVPNKDWLKIIDKLNIQARNKNKKAIKEQKREAAEEMEKQKASLWQKLKNNWGLS